jgi:hypothetical protein
MRVSVEAPVPVRSLTQGMERAYGRVEDVLFSSLGVPLAGGLAVMAVIGLILGATWPATTADEGTALSTAKAALGGGHQWIEMLAPPLQVAVYVPFFIFGHPELATVVPALFAALLLVLVVAVAWRVTGMLWAGAMSGLLLLSSAEYWHRSFLLPAYQMFVFFGYLGLALIASACRGTRRSTALAIGGGVALALSACSFNIGLVFLPAALLLAFAGKVPWRRALLGPAVAGVLLVPFAVWHVAVAGVRNAWIYPHSFLVVEHSADLQRFRHLSDYDLLGYITQGLPGMLLGVAPIWLWLLAVVGLLVIGKTYGARVSAATVLAMVVALFPFVAVKQLPNARYGYLLVPAIALVAGVGLALALQSLARYQAGRRLLLLGVSLLAVVGASAAVSIHLDEVRAERGSLRNTELRDMASRIDDDRAVLGRASYLQVLLPDNQVYSPLFLSEAEYLDYVLWEDEGKALQLFGYRDIGWVMFQKPVWKWERTFNEWAFRETGQPPRYFVCLPKSAGFTEVYDGESFALYKVDEGWLESGSASGSCPVTACELQSLPGDWRLEPGLEPGQVADGNYYCE